MESETFSNAISSGFWKECAGTMPQPYLAVVLDVLRVLDAAGEVTSVRSRWPSKGAHGRQGKIPLLTHSINVARICGEVSGGGTLRCPAMIAGLAHDIGKLPQFHQGEYVAVMHAHCGAVGLAEIIGLRLNDREVTAVINAVEKHHIPGSGAILKILRKADRLAREREEQTVVAAISSPTIPF
ncbi:MAG: HD domain-containing protein [Geobacter sp.]|nr:MAG: HD domain-containing protein [Geobacter sp.]